MLSLWLHVNRTAASVGILCALFKVPSCSNRGGLHNGFCDPPGVGKTPLSVYVVRNSALACCQLDNVK